MATMLFAALLIVSSLTIASSLECYSCVRENEPDADKYCEISSPSSLGNNKIINCTSGENRCIITKTVKDNSVTQFRRDCGKEEGCTNKCTEPDSEKTVICNSCCDENLCNKGTGPIPAELSGTSRITMTWGLYAVGGFLTWFFL